MGPKLQSSTQKHIETIPFSTDKSFDLHNVTCDIFTCSFPETLRIRDKLSNDAQVLRLIEACCVK